MTDTTITWNTDQPNVFAGVENDQRAHLGDGTILFVRYDAIGRSWYSYGNRPGLRSAAGGYATRDEAKAAIAAIAAR